MIKLGQKKKLTPKEKMESIVKESNLKIAGAPWGVAMEFSGKASAIPSMKNSKLPGKNFANPEFLSRVKAMDKLWNDIVQRWPEDRKPHFPKELKVHLLIINARRSRSFDPIGCLETVQDWLEPSTKLIGRKQKGNQRRWGIGLIDDDSQVVGMSVRHNEHHLFSLNPETTYIFLELYSRVSDSHSDFINRLRFP